MALESRKIVEAFKTFDLDNDGEITTEELMQVLMRPGSAQAMSRKDAEEFINQFDLGAADGKLSLKEFGQAWGSFGTFLSEASTAFKQEKANAAAAEDIRKYDLCIGQHREAIEVLFRRLDVHGDHGADGHLSANELSNVVAFYHGEVFDAEEFFSWYDVHQADGQHHGPDGQLDLREFGWYIADCAHCDPNQMRHVLENFTEAVDYVLSKSVPPPSTSLPSLFKTLKTLMRLGSAGAADSRHSKQQMHKTTKAGGNAKWNHRDHQLVEEHDKQIGKLKTEQAMEAGDIMRLKNELNAVKDQMEELKNLVGRMSQSDHLAAFEPRAV
eukprot:CAMPEP_0174731172 /NCGR_PEP_ID=MMETSP1094-20130205/57026_1 /TAXON_ID=156173 /ORGANISM="Chrysochromulina brevifilum, Strain UTEX LB 985" /LENGTH=326 /DNA_ID=CAMNT_0015933521 /DNA_START=64 /DNA_END=1044 /DNA_ORIENTATION=-